MSKPDTNAVRQVLMNELGLTRETIRAEMRAIVEDTVERHFSQMNIAALACASVESMLSKSYGGDARDILRQQVRDEASKRAAALFDHLFPTPQPGGKA